MNDTKAKDFLHELNIEYPATKACLEGIPESLFEYKPHPKSMKMGDLALLVAEMPLWIKQMITDGEIDFATFNHASPKTNKELVDHFEESMAAARKVLESASDEALQGDFTLKANGQVLYTAKKIVDIGVTLNHWVHHRRHADE